MSPRRGKLSWMGKRDYGQTSSVLLANQEHRFKVALQKCRDANFKLNDAYARAQQERSRLEAFLEEKGLLDQWQCEDAG